MSLAVQAQNFTLAGSGVTNTATSIVLKSFKLPDGTTNIVMANFGPTGYGTLEPGTTKEESISFTGVTQNGNGTATLTGVTRGLAFVSPFAETTANKFSHAGGAIFIISNTSAYESELVDAANNQTIGGVKTFTSIPVLPAADPTTVNQATRKGYVDTKMALAGTETVTGQKTFPNADANRARIDADTDTSVATAFVTLGQLSRQAIAGAADASTTVKGLVEEATSAEMIAGTAAGATGARLFLNPSLVAESGADKILKTTSAGLLSESVSPTYFTDGSDGDVTISSPTNLTRDMYYNNLVVNSTLNTAGWRIFANSVSGTGTIANNGASGTAGANGVNTGAGTGANTGVGVGGAAVVGYFSNIAGVNGGNGGGGAQNGVAGTVGNSIATCLRSNGVAGGNGSSVTNIGSTSGGGGGAAGTATAPLTKFGVIALQTLLGIDITSTGASIKVNPQAGSGAGGGGGGAQNGTNANGGAGGGSGASGGIVFLAAKTISGTFTIAALGGNGGNGGNGAAVNSGQNSGGGGGGAGGNGGVTIMIYKTKTWTGSYTITGGTGGTKGTGGNNNGTDGTVGTTGYSYEISIQSLIR